MLYVEDATRAVSWYERLGFHKEWEHQFEPGFPWFVSVARGQARLYLSEHKGDARPNTLIHLYVDDIDAVSRSSASRSMRTVWPDASATSTIPTATGCGWQRDAPEGGADPRGRARRLLPCGDQRAARPAELTGCFQRRAAAALVSGSDHRPQQHTPDQVYC